MSAVVISGKELSSALAVRQAERAAELRRRGLVPCLAVILAGQDPASAVYVRNKEKACERIGIESRVVRLPESITQEELNAQIDALNEDPGVHGLLVQLPLPSRLDEAAALMRVQAEKDVDGFHLLNAGRLLQGDPSVLPCTAAGILYMLKSAGVPMDGAHAVVLGRSNIAGKPAALLLLRENCTVTICHSHTRDLPDITRQADILVSAVGKAGFVKEEMVRPGAAVIDVGINRVDGRLCGDVDYEAVSRVAGWITPVPGGVGPMTVAMLMENTLEAACRALR
ncbi:MAG: bifunctional methylenetetrahydrofolate dehydrogenase/methenyltetrahydrofolate cyclohydrolase FolD [Clostridia bacterium]|nr:bifunctional methylenetetrahydrofolate dehydrogenase/methenyltetrahydrofolate cyclohydrolase FolD [Clostridia bacterium]